MENFVVHGLRRGVYSLGLAVFTLLLIIQSVAASSFAFSIQAGKEIFDINCSGCHTIGGGDLSGPDLVGVTQQRDQQWLISFISNPGKLIASNDPVAVTLFNKYNNLVMPTLGLSQAQVTDVISYLGDPSGVTPVSTPGGITSTAIPAGNPDNGRDIFINNVKLANGGPACVSCHSIDDVGILGGGTLGPNLTQAAVKYKDKGVLSALANITFPTMQPIFADHPLTANEQADLAAFITSQAGKPQVNKETLILTLSLAGFIAVMGVAAFYWRGRLGSVRQRLVKQARSGKH